MELQPNSLKLSACGPQKVTQKVMWTLVCKRFLIPARKATYTPSILWEVQVKECVMLGSWHAIVYKHNIK